MFRAKDILEGREVIILDVDADDGSLDQLRERGRAGQLRCPTCNHPVIARAGEIRVWHFAHRHDANCPSHNEPAELLVARAALYRWLKTKFADGVTVEKQLPDVKLPRPFDCWVEANGVRLAYWIVFKRMKVDDRNLVKFAAANVQATINIVFLSTMMQRNGPPRDVLYPSTTEREFICPSKYDVVYALGGHGSLHYLNTDESTVTTFRTMRCTSYSCQYTGHEISTPPDKVLVWKTTGEFVHADEQTRWKEYEEQQRAEEQRRREEDVRREREREERRQMVAASPRQTLLPHVFHHSNEQRGNTEGYECAVRARTLREEAKQAGLPPPVIPALVAEPGMARWEAICVHCGAVTRDWVMSSGDASRCVCIGCHSRGMDTAGL